MPEGGKGRGGGGGGGDDEITIQQLELYQNHSLSAQP